MIRARATVFMDTPAITKWVDRGVRKFLYRAGAYARTVARRRIRKRKRTSRPGESPTSHAPHPLRTGMLYFVDAKRGSVTVGPLSSRGQARSHTITQTIEHGGTERMTVKGKIHIIHYAPRPFMGPTLAAIEPDLPRLYAESQASVR
jgi:hypothetical protein